MRIVHHYPTKIFDEPILEITVPTYMYNEYQFIWTSSLCFVSLYSVYCLDAVWWTSSVFLHLDFLSCSNSFPISNFKFIQKQLCVLLFWKFVATLLIYLLKMSIHVNCFGIFSLLICTTIAEYWQISPTFLSFTWVYINGSRKKKTIEIERVQFSGQQIWNAEDLYDLVCRLICQQKFNSMKIPGKWTYVSATIWITKNWFS